MKHFLSAAALLWASFAPVFAQEETKSPLTVSGYLETFYSYDFNKPANHIRQPFAYSHNRHNEVSLNLGLIRASYNTVNVRANVGLMAGAYANDNLAAEPGVLKSIYEANVGVKISKKHDLWVYAGVFSSHIGFESAIGKDCWTVTRSILADNSPYFETGAKLSYTSANGKWFMSGLILNGWQRIERIEGNNTPAFGHQLIFKPSDKITLNSSSFVGSDKVDTARQMRLFHDFYGQFQFSEQFALIAGFDFGAEQKEKGSSSYNTWYNPILIARYAPSEKVTIAARGEYYQDKNGVIIATNTPNGFQTWAYSLNLDYLIADNIMWRIEARNLSSKDAIFVRGNNPVEQDFFVTTALAISF